MAVRTHGHRAALALAALTAIAACGSEEGGLGGGYAAVGKVLGDRVAGVRGGGSGSNRLTATDAQLRAYPQPVLLIETPATGALAGVTVQTAIANAVTWGTADGVTLTLRDGVLISTAGLGDDLMSAETPDVRRQRGEVVRDHYRLGRDETVRRIRRFCTLEDAGTQTVTVTGIARPARRVVETCGPGAEGDADEARRRGLLATAFADVPAAVDPVLPAITNTYWIEADGLIRKSRQYVSPGVGYVIVSDVQG